MLALIPSLIIALDHEMPPTEYAALSADRRYKLVMLLPNDTDGTKTSLSKDYRQSGMYLNDGSTKPLWTAKWFTRHALVANDGLHVVALMTYPRLGDNWRTPLITFYCGGEKTRSYDARQLFDDYAEMSHTVSHYHWVLELWCRCRA